MKQQQKTNNTARKKAAILKDAAKLFAKCEPIDRVHEKLAKKYFVSKGTIYRSIIEQRLSQVENSPNKDGT